MIYSPPFDYNRRRYWLVNGWSMRFRVRLVEVSEARPHGLKYSFTLHDVDNSRLLGFDNAHGMPRVQAYDHSHGFQRTEDLEPYEFRDATTLLIDFFDAVERACKQSNEPFEFESDEVELEAEDDDDGTQITG
jgi:Family of unknown function (DUF6516)